MNERRSFDQPIAEVGNDRSPASEPAPRQMQAIVQHRYGTAEVLELQTVDRPEPGRNEVLIEVEAAGVDRGVWHLVTGLPYLVRLAGYGITKPKNPIPGLDVAGRIVAVGPDVTRFQPGDEVFGIAKGSYADYTAADENKLAHKPSTVTSQQAAVAAISGITALQALTDIGGVRDGQSVLVIGASGGVGTYAVQLAKAFGAIVTGASSAAKADLVRSIGADRVIDYAEEDFVADGPTYDLILDIGGRNSIRRLRRALQPAGTLVIVGGEGGGRWTGGVGRQLRAMLLSPFVGQRLTTFISTEHYTHIERLAAHIENGEVVPIVDRAFDLGDVPLALRELEAGRVRGKAVVGAAA